jgi:hypothetical protein
VASFLALAVWACTRTSCNFDIQGGMPYETYWEADTWVDAAAATAEEVTEVACAWRGPCCTLTELMEER